MKFKFVLGRAGAGKTNYCLNEIAASVEKEKLLLVPNQFSLEMEKNLVKITNGKGMDKAQVLSFERLAYRVFSLYGKPNEKIIDDMGKTALIKKILYDKKDSLKFYSGAYRKEGFINQLNAIFTEFYKYGIDVETINSLSKKGGESLLNFKLEDLSLIFSEYNGFIKDKFISSEQNLDLLSKALDTAYCFHGTEIWIDGFYRFTAQDYKVIKKLASVCDSLTVSLTMPENTDLSEYVHRYDPFYETKTTAQKIIAILGENACIIKNVKLKKLESYGYAKPLMLLEKEYFNFSPDISLIDNNNIFITPFGSAYDEVKSVVATISKLIRDEGYRFQHIAVCACDLEGYEFVLKDLFNMCGIPCFFDMNKNIYNKRFVEMIRALLETGASNFGADSVIRLLRSGLLSFETNEIDILENYLLEYGIKGYSWQMKNWMAGNEKYDLQLINSIKERLINMLNPFFGIWNNAIKPTVTEVSTALFEFIMHNSVQKKLMLFDDSKEMLQIWNIVVSVFEKIVEIMGDEQVDVTTFSQILEGAFEKAKEGFIPASQDMVIVGDIKRTCLPEIKVLFVIGLNDNVIPSPRGDNGLLSEADREFFFDNEVELGPYGVRETIEEQFLVYRAITKPTEKLYISYPSMGFDDNELRKSITAEKIGGIFPNAKKAYVDWGFASEKAFITETANKISNIIHGDKSDNISWFKWLMENNEHTFNTITDVAFDSKHHKMLFNKIFTGKDIYSSVTRIEKYISCPFSYFAEYGLNAKERKIYGLHAVDIGFIYHETIERLSREMEERGIKWGMLEDTAADNLIDICIAQALAGLNYSCDKFVTGRIKSITKRAVWALNYHVKNGSFVPYEYEVEFGGKSLLKPIVIELNEGYRLLFTGRIDRVDILNKDGKRYIKIIDYKSGGKKFDIQEAYYGLQLQLLLYMQAYLSQNDANMPGGVFYFRLSDPLINYPTGDGSDEAIIDGLLNAMKLSGLVVNDIDIINALHNGLTGESNIIPVKLNKAKKGEAPQPGAYSSVATASQFYGLMKRTVEVTREAGNRLISGDIEPHPIRFNNKSPCGYCVYGAMCGFSVNPEYKYRDLYKLKKDEVFERV